MTTPWYERHDRPRIMGRPNRLDFQVIASVKVKECRELKQENEKLRESNITLESQLETLKAGYEKTIEVRGKFHLLKSKEKSDKIAVLQAEVETMKWVIQNIRK